MSSMRSRVGAVKLFTYQPTTHQRRIISALEFAESDRTHFYDDCDGDEKARLSFLLSKNSITF